MLPEGGGFDEYVIKRFAKGIVSAVHLIHRGAVPLPRKDRVESEEWRVELALFFGRPTCDIGRSYFLRLIHRKRSPFPS